MSKLLLAIPFSFYNGKAMKKKIYLAGGCFWGVEAYYKLVPGVLDTTVGYANGNTAFPKYEDLKSGKATHAETLCLEYDDEVLKIDDIIEHFLRFVDPYSIDRQGHDEGHQYRSGIYYVDPLDGVDASAYLNEHLEPGYAIKVEPLMNFFPAESYHQDYLDKNPNGYCHVDLSLAKRKKI